jgi:hypothetical protein
LFEKEHRTGAVTIYDFDIEGTERAAIKSSLATRLIRRRAASPARRRQTP